MYTLDRFARNRYDSAIYKAKLKRNGVKIFYAKQPMPDTPEGIILESVLEGYAEYYSENLARSIKRGMKENALHGIAMGSPVLGYKIGNDRQYEIDPVGAKAVRTIFTMYAEGKSKTQIVNWLNENGFKTSRGNAFNKNSLSRILRNDKYIGVYRYDDVVLEDAVPPIIDKTLFDKVQATFRHNYTARAKAKAIEDYLLTTKVFCGHCGEPMVGESGTSKTGKVHHYYKCVNRKRKHNCEKKVEKKEWLERTVVEFTVQQVLTDENIEKISTRAMELIEKELQDTSVLIGLQERLKETNKRIKNLMSAIEQGIITPTTKERLEELEEERRDLEGQIAREEMKKPLLTKERIMYWLESFKRGDIEDVEYQRRIIDTLVNSVYVYDDGDKGRKLVLTFNISGNNTLTISSSDIERTAPADVPYNGQDQTWQPTVTDADGVALVNGQDYTVSYDKDDRTNVTGTITVTITGIGNYTGTVTRTYQITPKPVTITTNSDEKVFDNTALTAAGSVEGIVEGETYSFTVTGSQKWVGSSTNTYEMVWATEDNHYTAKQSNYTVSENVGTLTVTDGTPDNPRPNNPTRPSGQTTELTGNAFVDNVVTPVVETVKEKAAKIQEVFNSDDEDVPLADQNLDNHKCCILHFLIMLITLLVYALATKSMKKRQKKLHEVREELDCELARRGLPLSREKE